MIYVHVCRCAHLYIHTYVRIHDRTYRQELHVEQKITLANATATAVGNWNANVNANANGNWASIGINNECNSSIAIIIIIVIIVVTITDGIAAATDSMLGRTIRTLGLRVCTLRRSSMHPIGVAALSVSPSI